jgi:hypothetical protein
MTRRGKSHAGKKEFTIKCGERLGSENMCGEEVGGERPPHQKNSRIKTDFKSRCYKTLILFH